MRAARFYNNSDVRIEEVPEPEIGAYDVGIAVAWCGICGTDLREFVDGPVFSPSADKPNPTTGETTPIIIGHEMSGVVYQIGEGVSDFEIGDHVVVEPTIVAEDVPVGRTDSYNVDPSVTWRGLGGGGGGLSEKISVNQRWVHKISNNIPLDQASLIEPLAVSYRAVKRSGVAPGDTALITGAGPIGLLTTAILSAMDVVTIVSEPSPMRRRMAAEHSKARYVFDPYSDDLEAEVRKITNGRGVDVGFECSSNQTAVDQQIELLRPHGMLLVLSMWGDRVSITGNKLVVKEIEIRGSVGYNNDHPSTIRMVEHGIFDLAPFITHRIGLEELVSTGYDVLINNNENAVKVIVSPSGQGLAG